MMNENEGDVECGAEGDSVPPSWTRVEAELEPIPDKRMPWFPPGTHVEVHHLGHAPGGWGGGYRVVRAIDDDLLEVEGIWDGKVHIVSESRVRRPSRLNTDDPPDPQKRCSNGSSDPSYATRRVSRPTDQEMRLLSMVYPSRTQRRLMDAVAWCYRRNESGVLGWLGDRLDDTQLALGVARQRRRTKSVPPSQLLKDAKEQT